MAAGIGEPGETFGGDDFVDLVGVKAGGSDPVFDAIIFIFLMGILVENRLGDSEFDLILIEERNRAVGVGLIAVNILGLSDLADLGQFGGSSR